jgi:hypothetical protein
MSGTEKRLPAQAGTGIAEGAARLLRHDGLIFARGFQAAFATWRDRVLLASVLTLAALWLRSSAAPASHFADPRVAACLGLVAGGAMVRLWRRRLAYQAADGILAADALDRRSALLSLVVVTSPVMLLLFGLGLIVAPYVAVAALGGGLAGGLLGAIGPAGGLPRLSNPAEALRGRAAARPRPILVAIGLASLSVTGIFAMAALRSGKDASIFAAAAAILCLVGLTRIDAGTCRFLALAGTGPWRSATRHLFPAAAYALLTAAFVWPILGWAIASIVIAVGVLLVGIAASRIWLYQLHTKAVADWVLTLALVALGLAALAAPPIAMVMLPMMMADLYRRAAGAVWTMK